MIDSVAARQLKARGDKSRLGLRKGRSSATSRTRDAKAHQGQGLSRFGALIRFAAAHVLWLQIGTLVVLTALVYCRTLDVPFYLDDFSSIKENPVIYLWDKSLRSIISQEPLRWITYLSFALNYQIHTFRVAGYHLVNIGIHGINGLLVLFLIKTILTTPAFSRSVTSSGAVASLRSSSESDWIPFFAAAIFVVHPLHIQAVTYIVQRAASLAALFYLLAMLSYLKARIGLSAVSRIGWAALCLMAILCAFFTKQNTATLPVALVLMELLFWEINRKKLLLIALIGTGAVLGAWMLFAKALHLDPFSLQSMIVISQETKTIPRTAYLMTQFRVLWTYLGLYLFPARLCIDYQGYPIFNEFWQTAVLYSFAGHIVLIGIGIGCIRRYRLVAFGIFFYYLAHLVESSVVPISDVVFEHRAYLPDAGLCAVLGWVFGKAYPNPAATKVVRSAAVCVVIVLALTAFQRNQVWRNPIALWGQNVEQQPENQRAWETYGKFLVEAGRYAEAIVAIEKAAIVEKDADGQIVHRFTEEALLNLIVANYRLKRYEKAQQLVESGLAANPTPLNRAKMLNNYANMMRAQGRYSEADSLYREAIRVYPQGMEAKINLSSLLIQTGRPKEARQILTELDRIEPNNPIVRQHQSVLDQVEANQP